MFYIEKSEGSKVLKIVYRKNVWGSVTPGKLYENMPPQCRALIRVKRVLWGVFPFVVVVYFSFNDSA